MQASIAGLCLFLATYDVHVQLAATANVAAVGDTDPVTLECETSATTVSWERRLSTWEVLTQNGTIMTQYGVNHYSTDGSVGVRSLIIYPVRTRDAGRYMCSSSSNNTVLHYMELVVLIETPKCTCPHGELEALDGARIDWECSAKYKGKWAPSFSWTGPGDRRVEDTLKHIKFEALNTNSGLVTSSISLRMSQIYNGSVFRVSLYWERPNDTVALLDETNAPRLSYNLTCGPLIMVYAPRHMWVEYNSTNEYITGHADANPKPHFEWRINPPYGPTFSGMQLKFSKHKVSTNSYVIMRVHNIIKGRRHFATKVFDIRVVLAKQTVPTKAITTVTLPRPLVQITMGPDNESPRIAPTTLGTRTVAELNTLPSNPTLSAPLNTIDPRRVTLETLNNTGPEHEPRITAIPELAAPSTARLELSTVNDEVKKETEPSVTSSETNNTEFPVKEPPEDVKTDATKRYTTRRTMMGQETVVTAATLPGRAGTGSDAMPTGTVGIADNAVNELQTTSMPLAERFTLPSELQTGNITTTEERELNKSTAIERTISTGSSTSNKTMQHPEAPQPSNETNVDISTPAAKVWAAQDIKPATELQITSIPRSMRRKKTKPRKKPPTPELETKHTPPTILMTTSKDAEENLATEGANNGDDAMSDDVKPKLKDTSKTSSSDTPVGLIIGLSIFAISFLPLCLILLLLLLRRRREKNKKLQGEGDETQSLLGHDAGVRMPETPSLFDNQTGVVMLDDDTTGEPY